MRPESLRVGICSFCSRVGTRITAYKSGSSVSNCAARSNRDIIDSLFLLYNFVHRAAAITMQIERHVVKSNFAESPGEFANHFMVEHAAKFLGGDLQPHQLVVMAHAKFAKTKFPKNLLSAIHGAQSLNSDARAIGDARRQAWARRFVPCG